MPRDHMNLAAPSHLLPVLTTSSHMYSSLPHLPHSHIVSRLLMVPSLEQVILRRRMLDIVQRVFEACLVFKRLATGPSVRASDVKTKKWRNMRIAVSTR